MPHNSLFLPFLALGALASAAHVGNGGVGAPDIEVEPQVDPVSAQISFVATPKRPVAKPVTSRVDPASGQAHFDISPQGTLMSRSFGTVMSKAVAFTVALIEIPQVRREIEHFLNKPIPAASEVVRRFFQRQKETQDSKKKTQASEKQTQTSQKQTQASEKQQVSEKQAEARAQEEQLQKHREAKKESEKVETKKVKEKPVLQERTFLDKRDKVVDAPVRGACRIWSVVVGSLVVAACVIAFAMRGSKATRRKRGERARIQSKDVDVVPVEQEPPSLLTEREFPRAMSVQTAASDGPDGPDGVEMEVEVPYSAEFFRMHTEGQSNMLVQAQQGENAETPIDDQEMFRHLNTEMFRMHTIDSHREEFFKADSGSQDDMQDGALTLEEPLRSFDRSETPATSWLHEKSSKQKRAARRHAGLLVRERLEAIETKIESGGVAVPVVTKM